MTPPTPPKLVPAAAERSALEVWAAAPAGRPGEWQGYNVPEWEGTSHTSPGVQDDKEKEQLIMMLNYESTKDLLL